MLQIVTNRLIIRDHIEEDLSSMHELLSSKKEMFYLPNLKTSSLEESNQKLREAIKEADTKDRQKFFFAIIEKDTGDYIGEIGFTKKTQSDIDGVMELGYFIKEAFWGKGLVQEASRALINFAFDHLNSWKIVAGCVVDNKASERIMKKLGMKKEAEFKNHVLLDNKRYDRVEYMIIKEEWVKRKNESFSE